MGLTIQQLIERTYREFLYAGGANMPTRDTLNANITSSATSLTTNGLNNYVPSTIIEIGSEAILVQEAETTTTLSPVVRGYRGTTAAAHTAGDLILVNPKWLRQDVFDALSEAIASLFPMGLYKLNTTTTLTPSVTSPLTLPTGAKDVTSIIIRYGSLQWHRLRKGVDYEVIRETDPPLLQLRAGLGASMQVNYTTDFTAPTAETDDVTDTLGVPSTLAPFLPMAAAANLLRGHELPRIAIEEIKGILGSEGIPVGAHLSVSGALDAKFNEHVSNERVRQRDRTPPRPEFVSR